MWYKGFLLTLAAILMLGFSMGCEPEHEDPMEDPGAPEGYEEPAPNGMEQPGAPEGMEEPGAPEDYEQYDEPGEEEPGF